MLCIWRFCRLGSHICLHGYISCDLITTCVIRVSESESPCLYICYIVFVPMPVYICEVRREMEAKRLLGIVCCSPVTIDFCRRFLKRFLYQQLEEEKKINQFYYIIYSTSFSFFHLPLSSFPFFLFPSFLSNLTSFKPLHFVFAFCLFVSFFFFLVACIFFF